MLFVFPAILRLLVPKWVSAIALWPFIFCREKTLKANAILINHEKIHLRQQLELLVLPFYVVYGVEFMLLLLVYRDRHKAYKHISFEKEAYTNDRNLSYLQSRKAFAQWRP